MIVFYQYSLKYTLKYSTWNTYFLIYIMAEEMSEIGDVSHLSLHVMSDSTL